MPLRELKVDLTPGLRRLDMFSRRDVLSTTMEGEWATAFKGRGIEFAGFRDYQYGDDASLIDWKASLRAKTTLIREFEEYKNFNAFILFDVSDTMLFSSTDKLKCEYAAELIYTLADAINKAGDSVGMAMFNENFINRISPNIGAEIIHHIKANILDKNNYGGGKDIKRVLMMTRSFLKGRAVILLVSDFISFDKGWENYIQMMSEEFEVIAVMVRDPIDRELPEVGGQVMIKDPQTGQNLYIDSRQYADKYREMVTSQEKYIENIFKRNRGDFIKLTTDKDFLVPVISFFQRRSKRTD